MSKTVRTILDSAASKGVVIWAEGDNLKYRSGHPLNDTLKEQLRQHKAEILAHLNDQVAPSLAEAIPAWCSNACECYCRLDLPGMAPTQGCYIQIDKKDWRWSRLDRMASCPMVKQR